MAEHSHLGELSEEETTRVAQAAAGHSFVVTKGRKLRGGRINESFRIDTNEGPYLLRFSPPSRRERQVQFETQLVQHVANATGATPRVIPNREGLLWGTLPFKGTAKRQIFCWHSFVEGHTLEAPASPTASIDISQDRIAALLLPVLGALRSFEPPFRPVAETKVFAQALERLNTQLERPEHRHQKALVGEVAGKLARWERSAELPGGVVHADIHPGNIIEDRTGKLWLIDFDDAHVGVRALDWTLAALEFSWEGPSFRRARFETLLSALTPDWADKSEREAAPHLLTLLALKFAAIEASLETPVSANRYIALLSELRD